MSKIPQVFLKPQEAAAYLGVTKQRFYVIKYKYRLEPNPENKYGKLELAKVKRLLTKWKKDYAKKPV